MNDAPHTIPEHIAERVAKLVNAAEDMRQQAADDLKQIYADLREELRGMGWNGAAVSAEIAGFKGAIAELRLDEQAKAKREAKGDRIDVYADMLRLAGARARVREGRSYADAKLVETVVKGVQTEIGRTALTVAIDAMLAVDETADPETGEIIETQESAVSSDRNEPGRDASLNAPTGSASDEMPETVSPAHFLRAGDDGRPQTSTEAYQVKDAGQGGIIVGVYSEQEKAGGPQGGNEAASGLPAPVANSAPVIGHVSFATSSHINPDDMPEIPDFLKRDFQKELA